MRRNHVNAKAAKTAKEESFEKMLCALCDLCVQRDSFTSSKGLRYGDHVTAPLLPRDPVLEAADPVAAVTVIGAHIQDAAAGAGNQRQHVGGGQAEHRHLRHLGRTAESTLEEAPPDDHRPGHE